MANEEKQKKPKKTPKEKKPKAPKEPKKPKEKNGGRKTQVAGNVETSDRFLSVSQTADFGDSRCADGSNRYLRASLIEKQR